MQAAVLAGAGSLHILAVVASCGWLCSSRGQFQNLHSGGGQQVGQKLGPGPNSGTLAAVRPWLRACIPVSAGSPH